MKIETPQILWQNGSDAEENKNAPLYSVTMLESGFCQNSLTNYGHILATSGNSSDINLWKLSFCIMQQSPNVAFSRLSPRRKLNTCSVSRATNDPSMLSPFRPMDFILRLLVMVDLFLFGVFLHRNEEIRMDSHFWSTVTKESDLKFRLVGSTCEGINDISWSPDSKRFIVGSIDHTIQVYEDQNYDVNMANPEKPQLQSQWRPVYRNSKDHTHFVQGVAFDPLGVYVASMGSDRTVRVYTRKTPPKSKKKVLRPKDAQDGPLPPPEHAAMVQQLLLNNKFELGKTKTIKSREFPQGDSSTPAPKKQNLFADESTVESFFRRLNWTTDGAFLITPCALWHGSENDKENTSPSFATLLFARHQYDKPYKVLLGHEKVRDETVFINVSTETNLTVHTDFYLTLILFRFIAFCCGATESSSLQAARLGFRDE